MVRMQISLYSFALFWASEWALAHAFDHISLSV